MIERLREKECPFVADTSGWIMKNGKQKHEP